MIAHQTRCGLCGRYVAEVDREQMLEAGRWEWSEGLVDEARLDAHQCTDSDPYGARMLGRLADSEMLRPELRELIALALERRRGAGRPRWAVFTSTITGEGPGHLQVEDLGMLALDHPRTRVPVLEAARSRSAASASARGP